MLTMFDASEISPAARPEQLTAKALDPAPAAREVDLAAIRTANLERGLLSVAGAAVRDSISGDKSPIYGKYIPGFGNFEYDIKPVIG